MNCRDYKFRTHVNLLITLRHGVRMLPSALEHHAHSIACEKHSREYSERIVKTRIAGEDSDAFIYGLNAVEKELNNVLRL